MTYQQDYCKLDCQPLSMEYFALACQGVCEADIPIIMGADDRFTVDELIKEKLAKSRSLYQFYTPNWPTSVDAYLNERTPAPYCVRKSLLPELVASVWASKDGEPVLIEPPSPGESDKFQMIAQFLCLVFSSSRIAIASPQPGRPFDLDNCLYYPIVISHMTMEQIRKKVLDFVDRLQAARDGGDGLTAMQSKEWMAAVDAYRKAHLSRDHADIELGIAKAELTRLAGDRDVSGGGVTVKQVERRGSVRYKDIPAVKAMDPSDLDKYRSDDVTYTSIKVDPC